MGEGMTGQSKLDIDSYVNELAETALAEIQTMAAQEPDSLESVLKGLAVELWSDATGSLFLVADEEDARRLSEPRGTVYTADEVRRIVQIGDPETVLEIHEWKRTFNGTVTELRDKRGIRGNSGGEA
ncbi:MAG: hypothetical protein ACKV22_34345 [Bryobacteraceae bacterium]